MSIWWSCAEARSQGIDRGAVRRLERDGRWARAGRDCWVEADAAEHAPWALVHAALARHPDAVASHQTAAWMHGLLDEPPARIHLTRTDGHRQHRPGLLLHVQPLTAGDVDGLCTGVVRTVLDVALTTDGEQALAVADLAVRRGLFTGDHLRTATARTGRRPGSRSAKAVARLVDGRSESPLESRSRWVFDQAGLPPPRLQAKLRHHGRRLGRVDFFWEEESVVGEADGLGKYGVPEDLRLEKIRQDEIERAGYGVVRWGSRDLATPRRAAALVDRIRWHLSRQLPRV